MSRQQKALVVGLGIAGMSTAIRLQQSGWQVVVAERSPERRTGGYFIALFPEGQAAAQQLGVRGDIASRGREDFVTLQVDRDGGREDGLGLGDQPGAPQSVLRGDIEAGLWKHIEGKVEIRFDTAPVAIDQDEQGAHVRLRSGDAEHTEVFDLVVGADGMRSSVRRLAFGPDEDYLKPLDAVICAYQMKAQLPGLSEHESAIVAESRRALWVFTLDGTAPTVLFTYRTKRGATRGRRPSVADLHEVFDDLSGGGLVEAAFAELEQAPHHLIDTVNQVRMPRWHTGRVVLVGDAAWCLTLYSGMGATTGMLGGVALGDALTAHPGDIEAALSAYEDELRPFVTKQQRLAYPKSQIFVPSSAAVAWIRRRIIRTLGARAKTAATAATAAAAAASAAVPAAVPAPRQNAEAAHAR